MSASRIELDGLGSPAAIADKIHELEPGLSPQFDIEALCARLDIVGIEEITTAAFEAELIMDVNKAHGSILLAANRWPERRRFLIGHELGHFLIPTHQPRQDEPFECSLEHLNTLDSREANRRLRIEAEANRFAAALLMPPRQVRAAMTSGEPDLGEVVRLGREFGVSKEAMARSYCSIRREAIAIIILHLGLIRRVYRDVDRLPRIAPWFGQSVPEDSIACGHRHPPGEPSEIEECDPEVWFDERITSRVEVLTEQVLGQRNGYTMILLHAELADD